MLMCSLQQGMLSLACTMVAEAPVIQAPAVEATAEGHVVGFKHSSQG